ncbi:unnamed protein product [Protopolystoma xenopodis]|uniref:Uncharacterized protein n=1 Tax=Protopolystoma xenopodis TaxID=117903 RepID=A0A3S5BFS7_9PLAT|nr:unnamed protein product [Protopolystoma xenopodis]
MYQKKRPIHHIHNRQPFPLAALSDPPFSSERELCPSFKLDLDDPNDVAFRCQNRPIKLRQQLRRGEGGGETNESLGQGSIWLVGQSASALRVNSAKAQNGLPVHRGHKRERERD